MNEKKHDAFCGTVKTTHNRPRYFSERLHEAMKGLGTDDTSLIRLIVSRCEIDLANIKYEFERDHGKTLYSAVKVSFGLLLIKNKPTSRCRVIFSQFDRAEPSIHSLALNFFVWKWLCPSSC